MPMMKYTKLNPSEARRDQGDIPVNRLKGQCGIVAHQIVHPSIAFQMELNPLSLM
jgi:hypothetical protein